MSSNEVHLLHRAQVEMINGQTKPNQTNYLLKYGNHVGGWRRNEEWTALSWTACAWTPSPPSHELGLCVSVKRIDFLDRSISNDCESILEKSQAKKSIFSENRSFF